MELLLDPHAGISFTSRMRRFIILFSVLLAIGLSSCQTTGGGKSSSRASHRKVKPVVSVEPFECLAKAPFGWNLEKGMAGLLSTELFESDDVIVLERNPSDSSFSLLIKQGQDLLRKGSSREEKVTREPDYIVRGTITDYATLNNKVRVAMKIKVLSGPSGEVISSFKVEGNASATDDKADKAIFGGDAFFRTDFGKATSSAVSKASKNVLRDIPSMYWEPRVAEAGADAIIINGGQNVRLKAGEEFHVREKGRRVTDPNTGKVIESLPGKTVGRVKVTEIKAFSAHAILLDGTAKRGDWLEEAR